VVLVLNGWQRLAVVVTLESLSPKPSAIVSSPVTSPSDAAARLRNDIRTMERNLLALMRRRTLFLIGAISLIVVLDALLGRLVQTG
jgi:hypothetical protein